MTLTDLYNAFLVQTDETSSSVSLSTFTGWANEAKDDMAEALRLESSFSPTIVAGTGEYALPADWLRLVKVAWGTRRLTETTLEALVDDVDMTQQGDPQRFYFWNGKMGFYPIPDASVTTNPTVYYYRRPADMDSDTPDAAPDIPAKYQWLILDFALARYHQREQEPDLEMQAMGRYTAGKNAAMAEIARNKRGRYAVTRVTL